ncbi:MAG: RNA polymerase sigma factor RpoD/SigA [Planctomycetota bacterium]
MNTRARRSLPEKSIVGFDRLDALLDVPTADWGKNLKKLVREFANRSYQVSVPSSALPQISSDTAKVSWPSLFEAQVKLLPRMDRAEEFRMARRYEFAKARVRDALLRAGHRESIVDDLVLRPVRAMPKPTRKAQSGAADLLAQVVQDLEDLRNLYVEGALYLVLGPVRRYRGLGVDATDLIQEGSASLFQAIEGFDWRREVRFKTYAVYWVQQAILKTLYNASRTVRVPIWVQKALRKIRRAEDAIRNETGSAPLLEQVAERVDMPADRVEDIQAVRRFAVSLDATIGGDDEGFSLGAMLPDEDATPIPESVPEGDLGEELRAVLAELPDREQMILRRRYGLDGDEPETLADIAKDLGVTAERVRQLQKAALERLKKPKPLERLKIFD